METKLANFDVISKLGSGAYSSVYKVKRISDGQIYALKKVKMADVGEREKQNALNEVRIIASIQHPNIVSYKECFVEQNSNGTPELCIIMEYAEEGDLLLRIQTQIKQQMYIQEKEIWNLLIQIILGLKVLHDNKIFHRDLKCANIFLFSDRKVKLGDFNVSKLAKKGLVYTQTGTPYYASPEVWQDKPYDHKADIWSLGCVIYEACQLKPPFRAKDMDNLYKSILKGSYPPIPSIYSQDISAVIKMLLQVNPENRPDCDQLLKMTYIQRKLQVSNLYCLPDDECNAQLLKTIKWPRSKQGLQQHKSELIHLNLQLPASNYNTSNQNAIQQANTNHIRKRQQSNVSSSRIKLQDVQDTINTIIQPNPSVQNIIKQIGKISRGQRSLEVNQSNSQIKSQLFQKENSPKNQELKQYYPKISNEYYPEKYLKKAKIPLDLLSEPQGVIRTREINSISIQEKHQNIRITNNRSNKPYLRVDISRQEKSNLSLQKDYSIGYQDHSVEKVQKIFEELQLPKLNLNKSSAKPTKRV